MIPFPDKKYSIIYADPPWSYSDSGCAGAAAAQYSTMKIDELKKLPVNPAGGGIAADDCVLFMWATYPKMQEALDLIEAWGFTYKSIAFQWVKQNRSGNGFFFGLGRWTSPYMNDPSAIVARAFAELYPGIDYHAQFVPDLCDESGNRAFGLTIFPDDGSAPIVCISAEAPISAAPELLAHELAHVATPEDRDHGEAWKAAEKAIGDKYDELLNAMIPDDDPGVLVPHEVGDGGLLLMPTRAHIPDPQRDDWKPATCPICGAECWETEIHRQALAAEPGLRAVCTDCGLRGAAGVGLVDTSSKKEEKDHE